MTRWATNGPGRRTARDLTTRAPRSLRGIATSVVAGLTALLLITAVTGWAYRLRNHGAVRSLERHALPAEVAANDLGDVYQQVHTAQQAFELTGLPAFSVALATGFRDADRLMTQLHRLLQPDATATTALDRTRGVAVRWRADAGDAVSARDAGVVSPNQILASAAAGERWFSATLRLAKGVQAKVRDLARSQLRSVDAGQATANRVAWLALVAAALASAGAVSLVQRTINRPLSSLLRQVRAVSHGETEHPIALSRAPQELSAVAQAAETMRAALVRGAHELGDAQRALGVRAERDRFAADLHDTAIQEVFGLGLALSSAAAQHPHVAEPLQQLIEQTDTIIRQLRTVIFDITQPQHEGSLSTRVHDVAEQSARALGFNPDLSIDADGLDRDLDARIGADLVAVLHETLSNVARHAHASRVGVSVTRERNTVTLRVSDNGHGVRFSSRNAFPGQGLRNVRDRAQRYGGELRFITGRSDGTTVLWQVPNNLRPG